MRPNGRTTAPERSSDCAKTFAQCARLLARLCQIVRLEAAEHPPECVRTVARMRPSNRATHPIARQIAIECSLGCARTPTRCIRTGARCARIPARMRPHVHANAPERTHDSHECASECAQMHSRLSPSVRQNAPERSRDAVECSPECVWMLAKSHPNFRAMRPN